MHIESLRYEYVYPLRWNENKNFVQNEVRCTMCQMLMYEIKIQNENSIFRMQFIRIEESTEYCVDV